MTKPIIESKISKATSSKILFLKSLSNIIHMIKKETFIRQNKADTQKIVLYNIKIDNFFTIITQ
jgi:hypothetical protein